MSLRVDPVLLELADERKRRGISAAKMADTLGVAMATVWAWEAGRRTPPLDHVRAYAEALGLELGLSVPDGGERS